MTTFLHQFVAVVTSLVLALPPGSCGVFQRHDLAGSIPPKAEGCHRTTPNPPCDSRNVPARPSIKCCCAQDATLPAKSVKPTSPLNWAYFVIADPLSADLAFLLGGETAITPIRSGPRLHVLQCVWRC